MAINSKKISGFRELNTLSGDEYLMVAYNNRSYKVKASLFTSDIIESIDQTVKVGDGASSPIKITTSGGDVYTFYVKNGSKGKKGDPGDDGNEGAQGNAGIAVYNNADFEDRILDTLNGTSNDGKTEFSDSELSAYALSAKQGVILGQKLNSLAEEYLTQEEYDERLADNKIYAGTKYFIIESE